jgi:hypothetical protein
MPMNRWLMIAVLVALWGLSAGQAGAQSLPVPEKAQDALDKLKQFKDLRELAGGPQAVIRRKNYLPEGVLLRNAGGAALWDCRVDEGQQLKECVCTGALDCYKLVRADECDKGTWWQDADDPTVLGCDVPQE